MTLLRSIFGLASALVLFSALAVGTGSSAPAQDPKNTIYLDTKDGRIVIALRPDLAPKHVAQIEALTKRGFYDGIVFHRVIDGFMAQTGDPTGTGMGKSDLPNIPAEFSSEPFKRGTVGMARSQDPDSANSQFFITFGDASFLNNKYTVVGQVVSGMDVVDKIKKGAKENNGSVTAPDKIIKMQIAADAVPAPAAAKAK
ncbi:peptidylprolyl isomerase [Methylocapsa palsarum]|uniref:Peptidyl-prolyl cis-trans isomerase n=1 Tax=Methylocapsa palsarum TaxID=1612308 RepID=A0A1I4C5F7_9HYPH|nr:peptidylprolyl isomerase [Methylocapsa palsarum]SFK76185.1 peptidylprolyl isomerase [Methylocapsa palsarum]